MVVTNNGFYDYGRQPPDCSNGMAGNWKRLSDKPHMDVAARENMGNVLFSNGWDEPSVLLEALVDGQWQRYRLPKASHATEQAWQTEWMRIREVETEHFMVDIQGMFYELQPIAFEGRIWGVKPICQHLRIIPDYCSYRGMLALGGNETTPNDDNNAVVGQPQSGVWFGKTDDLWTWGRPKGGAAVAERAVQAGAASDPFLLTGFERKALHLWRPTAMASKSISWEMHLGAGVTKYKVPGGGYKTGASRKVSPRTGCASFRAAARDCRVHVHVRVRVPHPFQETSGIGKVAKS